MESNPLLNKLEAGVAREPTFGPITMNIENKFLINTETGEEVKLTPSEYQILWLLVRAQGGIIGRSDIEQFLYEDIPENKDIPLSEPVNVHLSRLRAKLEMVTHKSVLIETRKGIGWQLTLAESVNNTQ